METDSDRPFDEREWDCVRDYARSVLDCLPSAWGQSSFSREPEAVQKAFGLLMKRGLARCRIEGRVTPKNSPTITVQIEVWDGYDVAEVHDALREVAGADESAEVLQCIREWSVTTLGESRRGCLSDDDLHQRRAPMQWRALRRATPAVSQPHSQPEPVPPEPTIPVDSPKTAAVEQLAFVEAVAENGAQPADQENREPDHQLRERIVLATTGEEHVGQIAEILASKELKTDEKFRRLLLLEKGSASWTAKRWAKVLNVGDSRIRQLDDWKALRANERNLD